METNSQYVTKKELYSHTVGISMMLFLTASLTTSALPQHDGILRVSGLILVLCIGWIAFSAAFKLKAIKEKEKLDRANN